MGNGVVLQCLLRCIMGNGVVVFHCMILNN